MHSLFSFVFVSYENVIVGFQTVITALNLDIKHMVVSFFGGLNKSSVLCGVYKGKEIRIGLHPTTNNELFYSIWGSG